MLWVVKNAPVIGLHGLLSRLNSPAACRGKRVCDLVHRLWQQRDVKGSFVAKLSCRLCIVTHFHRMTTLLRLVTSSYLRYYSACVVAELSAVRSNPLPRYNHTVMPCYIKLHKILFCLRFVAELSAVRSNPLPRYDHTVMPCYIKLLFCSYLLLSSTSNLVSLDFATLSIVSSVLACQKCCIGGDNHPQELDHKIYDQPLELWPTTNHERATTNHWAMVDHEIYDWPWKLWMTTRSNIRWVVVICIVIRTRANCAAVLPQTTRWYS